MLRSCTLALALTAAGGCYSPQLRDCAITCNGGTCPSGLSCEAGYCRVVGFSGTCTSDGSVNTRSDAPPLADGPAPDLVCSHTCYTPASGGGGGGPSVVSSGGCLSGGASNGCLPVAAWIDTADLCPCGSGFPILYVKKYDPAYASVAFVGPILPGSAYRLRVNGATCEASGGPACGNAATADCGQNAMVWTWPSVGFSPGISNSFDLYIDDGTATCTNTPVAQFAVSL